MLQTCIFGPNNQYLCCSAVSSAGCKADVSSSVGLTTMCIEAGAKRALVSTFLKPKMATGMPHNLMDFIDVKCTSASTHQDFLGEGMSLLLLYSKPMTGNWKWNKNNIVRVLDIFIPLKTFWQEDQLKEI